MIRGMVLGAVLVILGAAVLEVPLAYREAVIVGCVTVLGALILLELRGRE